MKASQLRKMSVAELNKLAVMAKETAANREAVVLATAKAEFAALLKKHGVTAEQVTGLAISKPKYKNPNNPKQTWTGKGRQPGWFKSAKMKGVPIGRMQCDS